MRPMCAGGFRRRIDFDSRRRRPRLSRRVLQTGGSAAGLLARFPPHPHGPPGSLMRRHEPHPRFRLHHFSTGNGRSAMMRAFAGARDRRARQLQHDRTSTAARVHRRVHQHVAGLRPTAQPDRELAPESWVLFLIPTRRSAGAADEILAEFRRGPGASWGTNFRGWSATSGADPACRVVSDVKLRLFTGTRPHRGPGAARPCRRQRAVKRLRIRCGITPTTMSKTTCPANRFSTITAHRIRLRCPFHGGPSLPSPVPVRDGVILRAVFLTGPTVCDRGLAAVGAALKYIKLGNSTCVSARQRESPAADRGARS
jgi:hypothetical protein